MPIGHNLSGSIIVILCMLCCNNNDTKFTREYILFDKRKNQTARDTVANLFCSHDLSKKKNKNKCVEWMVFDWIFLYCITYISEQIINNFFVYLFIKTEVYYQSYHMWRILTCVWCYESHSLILLDMFKWNQIEL